MLNRIIENIESHEWRFAKTMPLEPHWYTLRKNWNDDDFIELVMFIRENGYIVRYKKYKYIHFNINGFHYWTMGAPIWYKSGTPCTILINRAKIEYETPYDLIAEEYDDLFDEITDIYEDLSVIDLIDPKGSILDVGCGTGLFLNYVNPVKYTGIDISQKMLDILINKYPRHSENVINTTVKDFYPLEKYDTIIGLYGVGSYLSREEIIKIKSMLSEGGKMFLMFFDEGYYPVTYSKTGIEVEHNKSFALNKMKRFNNFRIWTYERK